MTSDLAKLMETINLLQSEPAPEPVIEIEETKVHPLLQAMQELKEEGIIEAKESIKDQIEKAYIQDGGNIDDYFVRHSRIDKLGYSANQLFKKSPDVDHPSFRIDYVGSEVGSPALWFYPLRYYLQNKGLFAENYPYAWLVKLKPNAWLQTVDKNTKTKEPAPQGKERVGILRRAAKPSAIFFKPGFDVVDKFYDYGSQHKRHGEVKGAPVEEEIAHHGTTDDINEFHPFTHFGTEKAAKDRMEYKKIKDGKIYKVDLDIKNPLTIKDFPGIHYDRQYAFELRDKGLISQEEMEAITFIQDKQELRKALLNKLNELGIDGFVYKNKYEDKGNISYVIVDPSQVKVLSVEPAAEAVTEASDNKVAYHVTPTQNLRSVMKNGLVPNIGDRSSKIAGEQSGIYLFPSVEAAEDAVMNWLGDEFDEDEPLTLLKVNINGLEKYISQGADYELIANTTIEPNRIHKLDTQLEEASPNTLEGSFTPDLVESKSWLAKMLAKGLKGKNAGTIYVLGSWYGNMGIFLQQEGIKFNKLVLVEPNEEWLMHSKKLLDTLNDEGKLVLIHQKAEDVVYDKPGVVINTSCNETGPVFLTKLPDNMLCLLQARNNVDNVLIETDNLEEFKELFPLNKTYFTGEKHLTDPETDYTRYMIIGRSGKKLNETISTGQGGGSAGVGGGQMVGGPTTYEQEYNMFKRKGPRRITAMTNEEEIFTELLTHAYKYYNPNPNTYYFDNAAGEECIVEFSRHDGSAEVIFAVDGETRLTGKGDSYKIISTVVDIIKDYLNKTSPKKLTFSADNSESARVKLYSALATKVSDSVPNYELDYIQKGRWDTYFRLIRTDGKIVEALDSSYPYEKKSEGKYNFTTDNGIFYKVYFQGKDLVEIAFSAILPGEEEKFRPDKTTLTGTGDSRKVFGTVVNIIKEYIAEHSPAALYFTATGSEPSRLRLYDTMISQVDKALPDYYAAKPIDLGSDKAYMLRHKEKQVTNENSITLNKLYGDNKPDRDDTIWDYGTMIWDNEYPIETINSNKLNLYLQSQYSVEHVEELFDMMDEEQQEIVEKYVNDPKLSNNIIVLDGGYIVDGNHRALAAVLANKPIRYIDIGEEEI